MMTNVGWGTVVCVILALIAVQGCAGAEHSGDGAAGKPAELEVLHDEGFADVNLQSVIRTIHSMTTTPDAFMCVRVLSGRGECDFIGIWVEDGNLSVLTSCGYWQPGVTEQATPVYLFSYRRCPQDMEDYVRKQVTRCLRVRNQGEESSALTDLWFDLPTVVLYVYMDGKESVWSMEMVPPNVARTKPDCRDSIPWSKREIREGLPEVIEAITFAMRLREEIGLSRK